MKDFDYLINILLKSIRPQAPNPLPYRKALDAMIFDALDVTEAERKPVSHWRRSLLVSGRANKKTVYKKRGVNERCFTNSTNSYA